MRAAPAPRRISAPDVEVLPARTAAVQSAENPAVVAYTMGGAGGATASGTAERRYAEAFDDWQTDAKAAARTVGAARFTANIFAMTAARVRLTIENDSGAGEWDETEDERYGGIMADYRNETLNQSSAELQRLHAWHYQVAGEGMVCNRDNSAGNAEWMVLSTRAIEWEKPQPGQATVRLTPNGSLRNNLAFAVTRRMLVRFWLPDEEFSLLPVSPMTAAMDDLRRWLDLTRYARRVALNYLTMNGLLWTPKEAHESETEATDAILAEAEGISPKVKDDPLVALYKQIAATSIANDDRMESVTPTMVWWGKAGDEPKWVDIGKGLDAEGLAHRAEALGDFARDVDAPAALVVGGGTDMVSSHWGAWLTEERFHGSIAPLLDRMFHQDLTTFYLHPLLRYRGVPEQDLIRWRVGYDPAEVIVHPDKSDLAMRAWLAGLLRDDVALREMGWNPDTDLADEASLQRLAFVLTRGMSAMPTGRAPIAITPGETPPAGTEPGEITGPVPDGQADGTTTTEGPPPSSPAAPGIAAAPLALPPGAPDLLEEMLGEYAPPGVLAWWPHGGTPVPIALPAGLTGGNGGGSAHQAAAGSTLTLERDTDPGTPPTGVGDAADPPGHTGQPGQSAMRAGVAPRLAYAEDQSRAYDGKFGEGGPATTESTDQSTGPLRESTRAWAFNTGQSRDMRMEAERAAAEGTRPGGDAGTIRDAIDASPPLEGEVYRGAIVDGSPEEVAGQFAVGSPVNIAMNSATTDRAVAEKFGGVNRDTQGTSVVFTIAPGGSGLTLEPQKFYDDNSKIAGFLGGESEVIVSGSYEVSSVNTTDSGVVEVGLAPVGRLAALFVGQTRVLTLPTFAELREVPASVASARLARVHPRTDPQKAVGAEMRRYRKLVTRLSKLRADTTRRLLAGAEVAFAEALRLAGIRAVQKGRNKNRALTAAFEAAWEVQEPCRSHLAALGITEEQILAGAFDSYEQQAAAWLAARTERERTLVEEAGYDPDVVLPGDQEGQDIAAAAFLSATLMALARQRIMSGTNPIDLAGPGEVSGTIPAQIAVQAMSISDGIASYTAAESADLLPTVHALQNSHGVEKMLADDIRDRLADVLRSELVTAEGDARDRIEEALGGAAEQPTEFVWTWGFYGEPQTPFEPHLALDGYTTTDPEGDPNLFNSESFPETQMYAPGDHLGCTCEWVAQVGANLEPLTTGALGPEGAAAIPGGRGDDSALARDLRAEAARVGGGEE